MIALRTAFIAAMSSVRCLDDLIFPRLYVYCALKLRNIAVCTGVKQKAVGRNRHERFCVCDNARVQKIFHVLRADANAGFLLSATLHEAVDVGDCQTVFHELVKLIDKEVAAAFGQEFVTHIGEDIQEHSILQIVVCGECIFDAEIDKV